MAADDEVTYKKVSFGHTDKPRLVDELVSLRSNIAALQAIAGGTIEAVAASFEIDETDDNGVIFRSDAGAAITVTVPNNVPAGFSFSIAQWGAGTVNIAAAVGATNRSSVVATSAQYKLLSILVLKNDGGANAEFVVAQA